VAGTESSSNRIPGFSESYSYFHGATNWTPTNSAPHQEFETGNIRTGLANAISSHDAAAVLHQLELGRSDPEDWVRSGQNFLDYARECDFQYAIDMLQGAIKIKKASSERKFADIRTLLLDPQLECLVNVRYTEEQKTVLHMAAEGGDEEMVRFLLNLGADPTACDCYERSPDKLSCVEKITELIKSNQLMIRHLLCNEPHLLKEVVEKQPEIINYGGEPPLLRYARLNNPTRVLWCLQMGADPREKLKCLRLAERKNQELNALVGKDALEIASIYGANEAIKVIKNFKEIPLPERIEGLLREIQQGTFEKEVTRNINDQTYDHIDFLALKCICDMPRVELLQNGRSNNRLIHFLIHIRKLLFEEKRGDNESDAAASTGPQPTSSTENTIQNLATPSFEPKPLAGTSTKATNSKDKKCCFPLRCSRPFFLSKR